MNNIKGYTKYFSLTLVLSFFILHNILLVLFGIFFALYDLNKNLLYKKVKIDSIKKSTKKDIKSDIEDTNLSLVYEIEEFGFIPSINKNDNKLVS
tara:strand:- start:31 stop:315 length:285 start_codon:yes stop_codon:yes gene_type:complete